jgi:hypothetical protein
MSENDENNEYILLNCTNAKKLVRYTTSINYYLFYSDYAKFKNEKDKIKTDLMKYIITKYAKNYAKKLIGSQGTQLLGSLLKKDGGFKIPKIPKGLSSITKIAKSKSKSSKLSKIKGMVDSKSSKSSKSLLSGPCEIIANTQSGKIKSSMITNTLKQIGELVKNFNTESKLNLKSISFLSDILTDEEMMRDSGISIIIRSMCDDPFVTYEACVLRKPTAIAQLALTGAQETFKKIDELIKKKYPKQIEMFKNKLIEFEKDKIKVLYITNKKSIITSISKFDLKSKQISINLQQKENKWIEKNISSDKVAFSNSDKNIDDYKKLKEKITINNISEYLIQNINDNLIQ